VPGQARIIATPAALDLILRFRARLGPLAFHQAGAPDEDAPMCFQEGCLAMGDQAWLLGEVAGCRFFLGGEPLPAWSHRQLILDVVPVRGERSSVAGLDGLRFCTRWQPAGAAEIESVSTPQTCDMSLNCPTV
jgi:hypothetical protein